MLHFELLMSEFSKQLPRGPSCQQMVLDLRSKLCKVSHLSFFPQSEQNLVCEPEITLSEMFSSAVGTFQFSDNFFFPSLQS